ncbi:MAG: hypothetical protein K8F91_25950, partial [Candidatus Obscuribacterales bacterium]|nr:hypothetical protein [Candidatus Obscuribacterales bacterium]
MKPEAISKLLKLALALCCMVSISVGYVCVTPVLADDSKLTASSDPGELRDFVGRMEKRIKSDPRPEFFTAKAQALEWLKRYSESTKAYSKAIDLDSGDSYLFFARGRVLRKQGLWRQAESDLTKAISIGYSTAEV